MVEKAYSTYLDKVIDETQFINEFSNNNIAIDSELLCISEYCDTNLKPLGNKIIEESNGFKSPKHLGFQIKDKNNPHDMNCDFIDKSQFKDDIKDASHSVQREISTGKELVLINKQKVQNQTKTSNKNFGKNSKIHTQKKQRNKSNYSGSISKKIRSSNLATFVDLFLDENFDKNTFINISIKSELNNINGINKKITFNNLFYRIDNNYVPTNFFHIFYGEAEFSFLPKNKEILVIKYIKAKENLDAFVYVSTKYLKKSVVGKEILNKCKNNEHAQIFFEGFFQNNRSILKGNSFNDLITDSVYIIF